MARNFDLGNIGAVFTCCLFPEMTARAMQSVLSYYPHMEFAVIDDACRDHENDLLIIEREFDTEVLRNERRMGTGRSIDRALRTLTTPLFLTVDHGVELRTEGFVEMLMRMMAKEEALCAGMERNDKRCNRAFGSYVDPVFAIWDREFILAHQDWDDETRMAEHLSFKLTNIAFTDEEWGVAGCSTAQFLQYRAWQLGKRPQYLNRKIVEQYVRHHRTPKTRGKCASPHEPTFVESTFLKPRQRRADGSLLWPR